MRALGFRPNSATGKSSWQIRDYKPRTGEATFKCFLQFHQILAFLGCPCKFSPAVTAWVNDDKQQDDRYKDTSQELLSIALDITFILSALIFLLKSYIISPFCGDVGKIHLILLSRLRCWMNIDHWAHSDFSTIYIYSPIFKTLLVISTDQLYLMKTILETHLTWVSLIHF